MNEQHLEDISPMNNWHNFFNQHFDHENCNCFNFPINKQFEPRTTQKRVQVNPRINIIDIVTIPAVMETLQDRDKLVLQQQISPQASNAEENPLLFSLSQDYFNPTLKTKIMENIHQPIPEEDQQLQCESHETHKETILNQNDNSNHYEFTITPSPEIDGDCDLDTIVEFISDRDPNYFDEITPLELDGDKPLEQPFDSNQIFIDDITPIDQGSVKEIQQDLTLSKQDSIEVGFKKGNQQFPEVHQETHEKSSELNNLLRYFPVTSKNENSIKNNIEDLEYATPERGEEEIFSLEYEPQYILNSTQKRFRYTFSRWQVKKLEDTFQLYPYPSKAELLELCLDLEIDFRRTKIWFQNKREKVKKLKAKGMGTFNNRLENTPKAG